MPGKHLIIAALDEPALLMPDAIELALAANDRLKYFFSLLQLACARADAPDAEFPDLEAERVAAGIDDDRLDSVIGAARRQRNAYLVPHAREIVQRVLSDADAMVEPLRVAARGSSPAAGAAARCAEMEARLKALSDRAAIDGDVVTARYVAELTAPDGEQDNLHLLVMQLHKELNRLQVETASATLYGARVHGLLDEDRELVAAFTRGVAETAALVFDHPGLGTIASRAGGHLVIQNDIGETDAHVLLVRVEGLRATITCTDVHIQRLEFFQRRFDHLGVRWEDTRSRRAPGLAAGASFFLGLGTFDAVDRGALAAFLSVVGAEVAFLIDWNRARKMLRRFVPKARAVALLDWAASERVGHRAFLELGGDRLVHDAVAEVVRTPFRLGEQLHDVIGEEPAVEYLRFVLRTCRCGLAEGRSRSLMREQIRVELFNYFQTAGERLMDLVAKHAAVIVELAGELMTSLGAGVDGANDPVSCRVRSAERAKACEARADEVVVLGRNLVARIPGTTSFRALLERADDVADDLEESVFQLSLLPPVGDAAQMLGSLGALVVDGARHYERAIEAARHLRRHGARNDLQEFVAAVDHIVTVERDTDEAQRQVLARLMAEPAADARPLLLTGQVAGALENASDSLMHAALLLRDQVMGDLAGGR